METNVKSNGQAKVANTVKVDKKAPQFVAGNPVNKVSQNAETEKETKTQSPTVETPKADQNKEQPQQAELTKKEVKARLAEKLAEQRAILERTIKLGDELARKIRHRDNLQKIVTTLDAFEVKQKEEMDETDGNLYQGCILTIQDDNGATFSTKNPVIIKHVADEVNTLCQEKLEEVENGIIALIPV